MIAVADHPGRANWFHWLIQVLPQIRSLANQGYDRVAVCPDTEAQWDSALHVANECGIELVRNGSVDWLPSKGEKIDASLVYMLRSMFLQENCVHDVERNKIFISRKHYAERHILNEQELRDALRAFEFVYPEKMSVFEQARLFNNASTIIGVHGSGLANVVFCSRSATVFEIRDNHQTERGWVSRLCDAVGCSHVQIGIGDYNEHGQIECINPDLLAEAIAKQRSDVIG